MSYWTGRITLSTGDNIFDEIGFQPTWIRAKVSQKYGTTETWQHLCLGTASDTLQNCTTMYGDTTTAKTLEYSGKLIEHYDKVSGVWTKVMEATKKSFDVNGFTINASPGNSSYKVHIECGN